MTILSAREVSIRQYRKSDVETLLKFVTEEKWDWSIYDHLAYVRLDSNYLLVAEDKSGEPVGLCGLSKNAPDTVYVSTFLVRKDLRGRGIGRVLWKAMLERAGNKNIVLDAVVGMVDWYMNNGLHFQTFKVVLLSFTVTNDMKRSYLSKYETTSLSEKLWPALMDYDRLVYPNLDRTVILRAWFSGEDIRVAVAMEAGKLVGYGSIHKKPSDEYGLRNVFGDTEDVIEALLHNLVSGLPEGTVVHCMLLDDKLIPRYIKENVKFGITAVRMYSKVCIETNTARMWLASTQIV